MLSYEYLWQQEQKWKDQALRRRDRRGQQRASGAGESVCMKRVVAQAHKSEYPNPISFAAGETVQLGREDTEFPGWIWVTTQDGNQGWAPLVYMQPSADSRTARTRNSYSARELNTRPGEVVEVLGELSNWTRVRNTPSDEGWVPTRSLNVERT